MSESETTRPRMTKTQRFYLDESVMRGRLVKGWGGLKSTLTVRILEERGYIRLRDHSQGWKATPLDKGRDEIRSSNA